jgi:hypothetical protein
VGSCLTGQLVGEQGKKVKGRSSAGRKVPSSKASVGELLQSASADSDSETSEPKGRPFSYTSWVVVLKFAQPECCELALTQLVRQLRSITRSSMKKE